MKKTISKSVLRLVKQSPSTAPEIGAILFPKMSLREGMRRASAHLCNLRTEGKIRVIGKVNRNGCHDKTGRRMANLYSV